MTENEITYKIRGAIYTKCITRLALVYWNLSMKLPYAIRCRKTV